MLRSWADRLLHKSQIELDIAALAAILESAIQSFSVSALIPPVDRSRLTFIRQIMALPDLPGVAGPVPLHGSSTLLKSVIYLCLSQLTNELNYNMISHAMFSGIGSQYISGGQF